MKAYLTPIISQFKILVGQIRIRMNNFLRLLKQKKTITLLIIVVGLLTVIFLVFRYLAPFGKVISYKFTSKLPGTQDATSFSPSQNNLLKIPSQIIKTSQARFSINLLSRNIESISAKLRFKRNTREILLGVRSNETNSYIYRPLYHSWLQNLGWSELKEGDRTLWQKEKEFSSLNGFANNVNPDKKIALYYTSLDELLLLKSGEPITNIITVITSQLRGSHTFLVQVDKAPLILKVTKQDFNGYEGEDKYKIIVLKESKTLAEQIIEDDGITQPSQIKLSSQEATITLKDINPGIYQIDLISEGKGSDSFMSKLEVNQKKIVLKNYVFLVGDKPSVLWTDAEKINMTTWHPEGLQTVKLNNSKELKIAELNKKYSFDLKSLTDKKDAEVLSQLEYPKNDVINEAEGYYAFSKDSYFNPNVIRTAIVRLSSLENLDNIDYVLTGYQKAKTDGDWLIAETTFDPKDIKISGDKLYFSLEMPDLSKYGGELEIDYLEIEAKSKGFLSKTSIKETGDSKTNLSQDETKKPTIFTKFNIGVKTMTNSIARTFKNTWGKIYGFFARIFNNPDVKKETKTPSPSPTSISIKTIAPTASLKPSPTPTATSSAATVTLLIRVLNGGAEGGAATGVAATLKNNGFTNVQAENADKSDYKGVTINYRKDDIKIAEKIELLLKKDYDTITKTPITASTAEIVVILGMK